MKSGHELQREVAWGCRILAMNGHNDLCLGHLSARDPVGGRLWMKRRGISLDEVRVEDVLAMDEEGNKVAGQGEVHLEFPLHTEVYKRRSDVGAVIHTHPPYATALSAMSQPLKLINHDSALFQEGLARFDSPELITTPQLGRAVAQTLGSKRVVLLRNHGILVVGKDVPWAVITALMLERAIQLQLIAEALGRVDSPMSASEAQALYPEKFQDGFIATYWDYLVRRAQRQGEVVE